MLEKNYLSKISPDGRTNRERIAEHGYRFSAAGESLGKIWFTDPVDPLVSAGLIFKGMLQEELNPTNTEALAILNPHMKEVGLAFREGAFRSGDWEFKVHLAICDVAVPAAGDLTQDQR